MHRLFFNFQVLLEGDYDTLHDIICQREKMFASKDRNSVIRKFYVMLQHLSYVDKLLVHLESFASNRAHYTLPDRCVSPVVLWWTQLAHVKLPSD